MISYREAYMQKKADLLNPFTWFESEDQKRKREAAKVLAEHNKRMEEIDPGYNGRMKALQDRDAAISKAVNERIDARLAGKPIPPSATAVATGTTAAGNRDAQLMEAAFASQQINPGTTVPTNRQLAAMSQRGTQKGNTAVAKAIQKPAAGAQKSVAKSTTSGTAKSAGQTRTAPPPSAGSKSSPSNQQAFQNQLNPATRSKENARVLATRDAAIRRNDAAKVTGKPARRG